MHMHVNVDTVRCHKKIKGYKHVSKLKFFP